MLQNLFPAINPSAMTLAEARRVVLFNYNEATGMVDFRHYAIVVKPVGVTKGVKRVIMAKNMPSLANFDDISEYVLREAFASESDVEDGPENSVTLAQDYVGRGNKKNEQRAIRLMELGPRMELKLLKVQAGLCEGDILFHGYIHKTKEEIEKAERLRQIKLTQQARRRQQQEANVERKAKDKKKKKSSKFDMAKNEPTADDSEPEEGMSELDSASDSDASMDSDDDAGVPAGSAAADDFGADEFNEDELFDEGSSGDNDSFDEEEDDDSDEEDRKPAKRAKKDTKPAKGKFKGKGGSKR
ncbi:rRNA-binding ribosome biosynthesis protein, partial [Linderina pennispora]